MSMVIKCSKYQLEELERIGYRNTGISRIRSSGLEKDYVLEIDNEVRIGLSLPNFRNKEVLMKYIEFLNVRDCKENRKPEDVIIEITMNRLKLDEKQIKSIDVVSLDPNYNQKTVCSLKSLIDIKRKEISNSNQEKK